MALKANKKQQECIDNIEGKYLVLAGPGTGKTFSVIQRIKNMINKGIEPKKILCLTFSDAAAGEMKSRLEKELDVLAIDVNIFTYHSFCLQIIEDNIEEFELADNLKLISEATSRELVKECIEEYSPKAFRTKRNDPYYFIKTIKWQIEEIKKYRLNKKEYFKNIEENPDFKPALVELEKELKKRQENGGKIEPIEGKIEKQKDKIAKAYELWDIYELYTKKMQELKYIDFNDMISFVLEKFEQDAEFLDKIANNYEYILVDEYQDTNKSQNDIVFYLTKAQQKQNVFVVGDDDQIIYTFQGARQDTIERFLRNFPDTKVICFDENMRSTQNILDCAREISKQDNKRLEVQEEFKKYNINKDLISKNPNLAQKNTKVRCYKYVDVEQEYREITNEIEAIINSDICPKDNEGVKKLNEIAILTRTNGELEVFSQLLKEKNIPYELKEGKSIFSIKSSIIFYYYLQILVNPELYFDRILRYLLAKPFSIHPQDYQTLFDEFSKFKYPYNSIDEINYDNFIEGDKIKNFFETYKYLKDYKDCESLRNVLLEVGLKTGIFKYYFNCEINKSENIAGLKKIIDEGCSLGEINKSISLEDFVNYLNFSLEDDIDIKTDKAPLPQNAIQLLTYYGAKGREFEFVFMPTLTKDKWESDNHSLRAAIPLSKEEYKDEDELKSMKLADRIKVMYVGMTRAKHTLRLSYVQTSGTKNKKPSELISKIQDMFEKETEPFEYSENTFWDDTAKGLLKREWDYKKEFKDFIEAKLKTLNYSPSSINTYLACPRQYLYNFILDLKTRSTGQDAAQFGTAVHSALRYMVDYALKNAKYPKKEEFLEKFEQALNSLALSDYETRENLLKRGQDALEIYYNQLIICPIEYLYQTEMLVVSELCGYKFKGYIDRVDKNKDGTFTIIDYKTGSAKTQKEICPEGKYENYYNQIGLYKYYFEKTQNAKVKEVQFVFPEDCQKNLTLTLDDEDCKKIEEKFKNTIDEIQSCNFEPKYDKEVCKYCPYKDFCDMEII